MTRLTPFVLAALGAMAVPAAHALGQDPPAPRPSEAPAPPRTQAPPPLGVAQLQVDVVIERHRGDRLVGRLPYRLLPIAVESQESSGPTEVKTGIEVPIPPESGGGFRNVGTTINCRARQVRPNVYWLSLMLQSNGVYPAGGGSDAPAGDPGRPLLNSLNVNSGALLRDGQTLQFLSSTSPVNGEVTTVEVTLKVLK